jgi:hypothetical protein
MELFSSLFKFPLQKYLSCCTWTLNCIKGKSTSGCRQRQRRGWFSFVLWLWWKEHCNKKSVVLVWAREYIFHLSNWFFSSKYADFWDKLQLFLKVFRSKTMQGWFLPFFQRIFKSFSEKLVKLPNLLELSSQIL